MNIDTNGFELEDVVRDKVTGYEGTIVAVSQFMTGCARVQLQGKIKKDGTIPDMVGFDVLSIEMVRKGPRHAAATTSASRVGGPQPTSSRVSDAGRRTG